MSRAVYLQLGFDLNLKFPFQHKHTSKDILVLKFCDLVTITGSSKAVSKTEKSLKIYEFKDSRSAIKSVSSFSLLNPGEQKCSHDKQLEPWKCF